MTDPAKAQFTPLEPKGAAFPVMFNPASLKVSFTNKLQDDQSGGAQKGQPKQNTQGTTSKLELDLIFDTSDVGTDVRQKSDQVKSLAVTTKGAETKPPRFEFRWGSFAFTGVIESLNETLDFWSSEGLPLRASMQVVIQGLGADTVAKDGPTQAALNKV